MAIIDSQIHAYEANTPKRPWKTVPDSPSMISESSGDSITAVDALIVPAS